jgi:hypothetical protein
VDARTAADVQSADEPQSSDRCCAIEGVVV